MVRRVLILGLLGLAGAWMVVSEARACHGRRHGGGSYTYSGGCYGSWGGCYGGSYGGGYYEGYQGAYAAPVSYTPPAGYYGAPQAAPQTPAPPPAPPSKTYPQPQR